MAAIDTPLIGEYREFFAEAWITHLLTTFWAHQGTHCLELSNIFDQFPNLTLCLNQIPFICATDQNEGYRYLDPMMTDSEAREESTLRLAFPLCDRYGKTWLHVSDKDDAFDTNKKARFSQIVADQAALLLHAVLSTHEVETKDVQVLTTSDAMTEAVQRRLVGMEYIYEVSNPKSKELKEYKSTWTDLKDSLVIRDYQYAKRSKVIILLLSGHEWKGTEQMLTYNVLDPFEALRMSVGRSIDPGRSRSLWAKSSSRST